MTLFLTALLRTAIVHLSAYGMLKRSCFNFSFSFVSTSLLLSIFSLTVNAEHVDVAPMPQEVIDEVVKVWATQPPPFVGVLKLKLDEAAILLNEINTLQAASDSSLSIPKSMILRGLIQELKILETEIIESNELDSIKDNRKLVGKVEKRFDKLLKLLTKVVDKSAHKKNKHVWASDLGRAIHLLGVYRGVEPPDSEAGALLKKPAYLYPGYVAPVTDPRPTFRQFIDEDIDVDLPAAQAPEYELSPRIPLNYYASNAPFTPVEASGCNYTTADLAETIDVVLTQEIKNLAAELEYSPAQIFAYVSNEFEYEPYYGSLKGAMGALVSGSGNATDHASLLVALLRASNIPARYVKGRIQFNDERGREWIGAKTNFAAKNILSQGKVDATSRDGSNPFLSLSHVWVEACVPYGNYRGSSFDNSGHHWIPMDASFKNKDYQDGIAVNIDFDYADYMSTRSFELPNEYFEGQVDQYIKTQLPRFENNTLDDVPYNGELVKQKIDIIPASLPYEVVKFEAWGSTGLSEVATIPAEHRYTLKIKIDSLKYTDLFNVMPVQPFEKGRISLPMPEFILKRLTLKFTSAGDFYNTGFDTYRDAYIQKKGSSIPPGYYLSCTRSTEAQLLVDGITQDLYQNIDIPQFEYLCTAYWYTEPKVTGADMWPLNKLKLTIYIGEGTTSQKQVNSVTYNNISSLEYHALQAYSFQGSDRLIKEKTSQLLSTVRNTSDPDSFSAKDALLGGYLDLVGLKYMRYITDAGERIGGLYGDSGLSGNHIGLTSSRTTTSYLFDLPYAVNTAGFLIDVPGGVSRSVDLTTGETDFDTFLLSGYASSAYESYIWQENARMDAVSSVRGIQYANDKGIEVLTLDSSNLSSQVAKLTTNDNLQPPESLNYSAQTVANITGLINGGSTVVIPRSLIEYDNWTGQVYIASKEASSLLSATFAIGPYAGGYTTTSTIKPWLAPISSELTQGTGWDIPTFYQNPDSTAAQSTLSSAINLGFNPYSTLGGDPVNMVTGNMFHTEKDISLKGRGLPIVFERTYNSMSSNQSDSTELPMGYGWTHSFNHYLEFNDDDFNSLNEGKDENGLTSSITWVDGTGAKKFITQAVDTVSGIPPGTTFTSPEGFYFTFERIANGKYTIREKNGITYTFSSVTGTVGHKSKLEKITDRNGNSLTLTYSGANLYRVTDEMNRYLQFGYVNNRLDNIVDWSGRRYEYKYDGNGNLSEFHNPLAVAGSIEPVSYDYYTSADGENLNHFMQSYNLPRGNGMTFEYYANGKVFNHSNTNGETMTFTYNDFRREAVTINERGFERRHFFDEKGNPTRIVKEGGGTTEYEYASTNPYNRSSQTDNMGYQTTYAYDGDGNVISTTNPSDSTTVNSHFNSFHQPGKLKDPNGNYTLYKYDNSGNRTDVIRMKSGYGASIDPASYSPIANQILSWTKTTYDGYGNPLTIKQIRDFVTQVGPTVEFNYTDTVNGVNGLNATSITRCGDRNGDGAIQRTTECDTEALAYDNLGRLKRGIGGDWYQVDYDYDSVDRVTRSTDTVGHMRDITFDENGNTTSQKLVLDKHGIPTQLDQTVSVYDLSDRVITSVDAGGNASHLGYDASGNITSVTSPDGYRTTLEYDANNQVIAASDEEGHSVKRELDIIGRVRSITDPNNNISTFEYYGSEQEGRLKRQTDVSGRYTEFEYDANGNVTWLTVAEPGGVSTRRTYTEYDALNRIVRIAEPVYNDPVYGNIRPLTKYEYDNLGNQTRVLAGHTNSAATNLSSDSVLPQETYAYDDLGRLLSKTDALSKKWRYEYDLHGNVKKITDPKNQITEYSYLYGGLVDVQTVYKFAGDPNPHITDYDYDDLGQLSKVTSPEVIYSYTYDNAHRLTEVHDNRSDKSIYYDYSPGGQLNAMSDSDGYQNNYFYDPVGRLTGLWAQNDDLVSFVRDDSGRLKEKRFINNGLSSKYEYNPDNTLAQIINSNGAGQVISQHDYSYDGFGNRETHLERINNLTLNYKYDYDPLNRLTAVRDADNSNALIEAYSYDRFGNRATKTTAGAVKAYVYDNAQQLKEIRQSNVTGSLLANYNYDNNGNLLSRTEAGETLQLTYNALNQQATASKTGQSTETYQYDPQGRRIEKQVGNNVTRFRYAGSDILAEYNTDWTQAQAVYTYGSGQDSPLIRTSASGTDEYYHQDGLGSVVSVTDLSGTEKGTARYDAWGNINSATGTINRYGYTGRELDDTGLMYYRARYYDPAIGRFTQRDPKGYIDGINQYAYVVNNPVNYTDPSGTQLFNSSQTNSFTQATSFYGSSTTSAGFTTAGSQSLAPEPGLESPLEELFRFNPAFDVPMTMQENPNAGFLVVAGIVVENKLKKVGAIIEPFTNKGLDFFRGAKQGSSPSLTPRPNEFKVDKATGTVKPTHGVSVFDNLNSVSSKGFVPHKVNQSTIPDTLQIIQRGKDPRHFEITPKPGANLTPQQFIDACSKIVCSN